MLLLGIAFGRFRVRVWLFSLSGFLGFWRLLAAGASPEPQVPESGSTGRHRMSAPMRPGEDDASLSFRQKSCGPGKAKN